MTKRPKSSTKSPPASPRTAPPTSESVLELAIGTLHDGLTALKDEIERVIADKADDNGHDKGSRIAFLTQRVGSIADSLRKVEAARAKRLTDITLPQVIAWIRGQPKDVQAQVTRELHGMANHRGGVLG